MLEVRQLEDEAGLRKLQPAWSRLVDEATSATPFLTPEWQLPWLRDLSGGGGLRALAVLDGQRLIALMPLFAFSQDGVRHLASVGAGVSDYLGLLASPGYESQAAAAALHWLASREDWDRLTLDELRPGDPLLDAAAPGGLLAQDADQSVCTALPLPEDEATLLASTPSKLRQRIPEYRRRIARAGLFEGRAATLATLDRDLADLFRLHSDRWQTRGQPGVLAEAKLATFHASVAAGMLARQRLRLHVLRLDGAPVGAVYAFSLHRRTYSYLSGMSPSVAAYSPGVLAIAEAIRQAITERALEFDMLRGDEPYKFRWAVRRWTNRRRVFVRR